MRQVGLKLGQGLAILIDVLNPEMIVIGSIYARQQALLDPAMLEVLRKEALSYALQACRIIPAGLGEQIGDAASLSVAMHALDEQL
jgi:glucokinase